ncbi:hypothetical protein D3C77_395370 [compost metagenome]
MGVCALEGQTHVPGDARVGGTRAFDLIGNRLAVEFAIDAVDGDIALEAHLDTPTLVADGAAGRGQQGAAELQVVRSNAWQGQGCD